MTWGVRISFCFSVVHVGLTVEELGGDDEEICLEGREAHAF